MTVTIQPMTVALDQVTLDDLKRRLSHYRRPPAVKGAGWRMGVDLGWFDELIAYWLDGFDWEKVAARLNRRTHLSVPLADEENRSLAIHVIVEPGSGDRAPILLTPGWPSCFVEFDGVIDRLAHPEHFGGDASEGRTVIVADLPGFGLSESPVIPLHHRAIAQLWHSLMVDKLGHTRFIAHGGDWGAVVSSWLALDHPSDVVGLHLSTLGVRPFLEKSTPLNDAEKGWLGCTKQRLALDGGYREVQATKPSTLSVGLADSPAALAAWMIEKFHGWSGCALDAPPSIDRDTLLSAVTLYWATNHLPCANWIYWADRQAGNTALGPGERIETPTGLALFDGGFFPPPPTEWAERAYNVVYRSDHPAGGHFPAWTAPAAFAEGLLSFARPLP